MGHATRCTPCLKQPFSLQHRPSLSRPDRRDPGRTQPLPAARPEAPTLCCSPESQVPHLGRAEGGGQPVAIHHPAGAMPAASPLCSYTCQARRKYVQAHLPVAHALAQVRGRQVGVGQQRRRGLHSSRRSGGTRPASAGRSAASDSPSWPPIPVKRLVCTKERGDCRVERRLLDQATTRIWQPHRFA